MSSAWTPAEEEGLVGYLVTRLLDRAAGRLEVECNLNNPRDVYFLGNLRSRAEMAAQGGLPSELLNKLAPVAIGAEVQLANVRESAATAITVNWAFYYRAFPTYGQQRRHQEAMRIRLDEGPEEPAPQEAEGEQAAPENERGRRGARQRARQEAAMAARDNLALRFKRIDASATARIPIAEVDQAGDLDLSALQNAIAREVLRCKEIVAQDPDALRVGNRQTKNIPVPSDALASEEAYNAWKRTFTNAVVPDWNVTVDGTSSPSDQREGACIISVEVINDSGPVDDPFVESYIFQVGIDIEVFDAELTPLRVELVPKGFRFDPFIPGRGHNCEVQQVNANRVRTGHTPIFRQERYVTRAQPPARFADLALEPVRVLRAIGDAMEAYREEWNQAERHFSQLANWNEDFQAELQKDRQIFEDEITRFRQGIALIETDDDVRLAFQLSNEAFSELGRHPQAERAKDSWRLFQVVFLVSQIAGIHALKTPSASGYEEREMVDVIYFPTGGGKTEAYLGTIVFHCFFDRLRGKSAGVTCWTRFPLRLLTLQQTQRMADAIGNAELIRSNHGDERLRRGDRFGVGYLVGAEATPNELEPPRDGHFPSVAWSQANDVQARQRWKRIATCPSCKTNSITVDFDAHTVRLIHRCSNRECRFPRGELPVFITDNEVFRYLPSVLVGTVDKLAGLGNQRKFALVLGQVDGRCREHGFYKGMCCQKGCKDRTKLQAARIPGLTGPSLMVQDELHLLKEGLGTFDSHYESFLQRLLATLGNPAPLKIIGSSATIEQFERQVEHLYGKTRNRARIFPGRGPTLARSFYAETLSHAQRIYVGVLPHNKTLFNAILELIESYHRELMALRVLSGGNPWGGALTPGSQEWLRLIDFYWVSLIYFLANRDLNSIHTDLEGDTNPRLQSEGLPALSISQLLGETSTDDVTATLALLERPASAGEAPRTVLATSMVSHGVDVDRLNAMLFYGMPRLTAEYIQASSRVGRLHVGFVLACLHPARERDQSHYKYFRKYHEFLGQLVEPVAINRWATYSIDRTIPGLFMAILLQLAAHRPGVTNPNSVYFLDNIKREISSGTLRAQDFVPLLEASYLVEGDTGQAGRESFRPRIQQRVQQFLDHILQTSGTDFVSEALIPSPMRSLRDVQEAITIELDSEGTDWARMQ